MDVTIIEGKNYYRQEKQVYFYPPCPTRDKR